MNKELLTKPKCKKEGLRWTQGQVIWEEYRDTVWPCQDGFNEVTTHLDCKLTRNVNGNTKDLPRSFTSKGRPGKLWTHHWMGQEMAWQGTLRGLNYKLASSVCPPQSQQVKFALPILCEKLWQLVEVPEDWRKALLFSRRARWSIQSTTDWSASSWFLGKWWSKQSWKPFLNIWKSRRWQGGLRMSIDRVGTLQPGAEKAQGNLINVYK